MGLYRADLSGTTSLVMVALLLWMLPRYTGDGSVCLNLANRSTNRLQESLHEAPQEAAEFYSRIFEEALLTYTGLLLVNMVTQTRNLTSYSNAISGVGTVTANFPTLTASMLITVPVYSKTTQNYMR